MKDTYYILAKVVWCGECDDFAIEKIIHIQHNISFTNEEIDHYINLDCIRDDEDESIEEYSEGGRLFYYVDDIDYDFDPEYDSLAEALALYTVYSYQQTEEDGEWYEI